VSSNDSPVSELIEPLPKRLEKELAKHLQRSETVLCTLRGAFKGGVVCTNTRVMILKGGLMTNQLLGNNMFSNRMRTSQASTATFLNRSNCLEKG
jgi:hypothetical protein